MSDRLSKLLANGSISRDEFNRRRQQQRASNTVKTPAPPRKQRMTVKPSATFPSPVISNQPRVTQNGGYCTVSYSEVWKVAYLSNGAQTIGTGFVFISQLPYLSNVFSLYQLYRVRNASISWEPLSTSDSAGTVALAPCYHPDPGTFGMEAVLNTPGSKSGPAGNKYTVPLDVKQFSNDWYPNVYPGTIPVNPPGAPKFMYWYQSPRILMEAPVLSPAGLFRVSYTIDFATPVMPRSGIHVHPDTDTISIAEDDNGGAVTTLISRPGSDVRNIAVGTFSGIVEVANDLEIAALVTALAKRGYNVSGTSTSGADAGGEGDLEPPAV